MDSIEFVRLILEIAALALSIGAFADVWFHEKKKITLVLATSALVLLTGIALLLSWQHERRVEATSREILGVIGPDVQTFDQVFHALFQPEFPIANEAMGRLFRDGKIGYRQIDVRDDKGAPYKTGVFYRVAN